MKTLYTILAAALTLGMAATEAQAAPAAAGRKAYLGVALARLTALDRQQKKVPRYGGVLIQSVLRHTPAYRAGFRPGDVIMRINNQYVYKPADVMRRVAQAHIGSRIKIDIIRNGGWMMARVLVSARPRRVPGHVGPRPEPPVSHPPRATAEGRGAILARLKALQREVRLLKQMIRELKGVCRRK
jgi:membrane-associated protease RseP (regulator of RpoE activity)